MELIAKADLLKKVCMFFGNNQYWACRVDPLFANSPVQVNIVNPDHTAPKGNGSLRFFLCYTPFLKQCFI